MKAIILAAGRGSRMEGLTAQLPKCMVKLQGRPLLAWQVEALQAAGIKEIGVVRGYCKERVQAHGITHYFENPRWQETNMVYSLMQARQWLADSPCIVSYGDIFYEPQAVLSLLQSVADIALTYDVNFLSLWQARASNPLDDLETFRIDASGNLVTIGEKAQTLEEIQGQYMGLLRFTPKGWHEVETLFTDRSPDKIDMTSMLRALLAQRVPITAIPYGGSWGEIDNQSDLALYEKRLAG
jgi:choline kinase